MLESAAVGSPDVARGEIVKAFVKLSEEYRVQYADASTQQLAELVLELQVSQELALFLTRAQTDSATSRRTSSSRILHPTKCHVRYAAS